MQDIEAIIRDNIGLVITQLKRLKVTFDHEAESIGYEALYNAALTYDCTKGYKFSTFASYYIKLFIVTEIYTNDRMIRRPYYYEYQKDKVKMTTIKTYIDRVKYLELLGNIKVKDFKRKFDTDFFNGILSILDITNKSQVFFSINIIFCSNYIF